MRGLTLLAPIGPALRGRRFPVILAAYCRGLAGMAGKIFINYRRDDDPSAAARVRDGLAGKFGKSSIFMDVDNLLAGQRFDEELAKALSACDVLIAVMGTRWMSLLQARAESGERDYVREEIAAALKRRIVVIPVRVGREGQLAALPRAEQLPEDIRDLVHYQKHDVTHERFGRDFAELIEAITTVRRKQEAPKPWGKIAVGAVAAAALGAAVYFGPGLIGGLPQKPETVAVTTATPPPAPSKAADAQHSTDEEKRKADEAAAKAAAVPEPGKTFRDCEDICPEMVVVPAGSFKMGSDDSESTKPVHDVRIGKPFAVGKTEVTFSEWDACVADRGCKRKPNDHTWGRGAMPVVDISWDDVTNQYLPWLSKKTSKHYRLLTEAEWEYAARAGTTSAYAFGPAISNDQAQFSAGQFGSAKKSARVATFKANAWGLFDTHGNVWEWVEDSWYANYDSSAPSDGSEWHQGEKGIRVLRGGSWYNLAYNLRVDYRFKQPKENRSYIIGFRVARDLE